MPCAELLNSAHELEQGEARFGSKTEIGPRNPDFRSSLNSRHSPTRDICSADAPGPCCFGEAAPWSFAWRFDRGYEKGYPMGERIDGPVSAQKAGFPGVLRKVLERLPLPGDNRELVVVEVTYAVGWQANIPHPYPIFYCGFHRCWWDACLAVPR
jgi:hypothetical protein